MAEKSYFYDSVQGDQRIYQAADLANFHAQIIGNGVAGTDQLRVTAKTNMEVGLSAGHMFYDGYMYENTTAMSLTHDLANPNKDRIDRVVIQFNSDPAERKNFAYIKKGMPADKPVAPSLERNGYVYELSVAQVLISAADSVIKQADITDERSNDSVCGYILLRNIYRGLQIDEGGIATMPNQSYIDVKDDVGGYTLLNTSPTNIPFGTVNVDRAGEIYGNTFKPKANGVYTLWLLARTDVILDQNKIGIDVQFHLVKNGISYDYPFLVHVTSNKYDNIWVGSCIEQLDAGDSISLIGQTFTGDSQMNITNTWLRIAKIS